MPGCLRRLADRPVTFSVDLQFEEEQLEGNREESASGGVLQTRIRVRINAKTNRDRRHRDATDRDREVLVSFRSYLMAAEEEPTQAKGALRRVKRILTPWLANR